MFILNQYDYIIPLRILGILALIGTPLLLSGIYLAKLRKKKELILMLGYISIIFGALFIILAIWGDICWNRYLETCNPCILFDYTPIFLLLIMLGIILIIYAMFLIHNTIVGIRVNEN
ncbi:MAG: hypothetical protein ACFE94_07045 [Candidatus Hodarchaeota archaeon]